MIIMINYNNNNSNNNNNNNDNGNGNDNNYDDGISFSVFRSICEVFCYGIN